MSDEIAERILKENYRLAGVRYNVIRRSAHKSVDSMLKKIEDDRKANRMDEWFLRFNVGVTAKDIERFKVQVLNPVLENLCDDYEWWSYCLILQDLQSGVKSVKWSDTPQFEYDVREKWFPNHRRRHYLQPFHYNPLLDGASTDLDEYLQTGSTVGLHRTETLFTELA